jgi:RNA 3'-terminal phosphate cyclase
VTTEEVTSHLLTNLWVVGHFVEREVRVEGALGEKGRLIVA